MALIRSQVFLAQRLF